MDWLIAEGWWQGESPPSPSTQSYNPEAETLAPPAGNGQRVATETPATIGGSRLLRHIGNGGMGVVLALSQRKEVARSFLDFAEIYLTDDLAKPLP